MVKKIDRLKIIEKNLQEITERQKETEEMLKKTSQEIDKVNEMVGKLTDGWGKFVEGFVLPSVPVAFKSKGIKIISLYQRAKTHYKGRTLEIDILATGVMNKKEKVVIIVEVKSDLNIDSVKKDVRGDLEVFFKFFKEFKGFKLIGAVAGVKIPENVKEYAEKAGLYVLAPSGENMIIVNKPTFKPRYFT